MKFERKQLTVKQIVGAWQTHALSRNPDYQRGLAWSQVQKQALIDSLFREYPIPPIFLERKASEGLFGGESESSEIIDGQQRILSMDGFFRDDFELLHPDDRKLRLPQSLRLQPTPWSGRRFNQLDAAQKKKLEDTNIDVYLVEDVQNADEVRDLFIRLQSGTALTRQQIRDAWPGQAGPWTEMLAGKLERKPKYHLFQAVDGRGTRDDEDDPRDQYVKHRNTCAQLLRVLFARMSDPLHFPSVTANDIDSFYHENTGLSPTGVAAQQVEEILASTQEVTDLLRYKWSGKKKVPKLSLFALAFFFQDMKKNQYFKFDSSSAAKLVDYASEVQIPGRSKAVSGPAIKLFYEDWLSGLPEGIGIRLDEKRLFDENDRTAIWKRDEGICQICKKPIQDGEAEYDHFPMPHTLGGRTVIQNGRLVHKLCHPRGRIAVESALAALQPPSTTGSGA